MKEKWGDLFITGTGTNVGKSVVSTILAIGMQRPYWKPIQAGLEGETDSEFVQKFVDKMNIYSEVYKLSQPLSPHLAASIDGLEIDVDKITEARADIPGRLIIEGAGGVLVPVNDRQLVVDVIQKLKATAIVVASSELGTINHTLLTLEALRLRNIPIAGVIMVGCKNQKNKEGIEFFGKTSVLMEVDKFVHFSREIFQTTYTKSLIIERVEMWN